MTSESTIMFHELNEIIVNQVIRILNDPSDPHHKLLRDSDFTFDDGLYSQVYYVGKFLELGKKCIIFVSTKFICDEYTKQKLEITSPNAHKLARCYDYSPYATIKQLLKFEEMGGVIGNHSYDHYNFESKHHSIKEIKNAVELQCKSSTRFFENYGFSVVDFAYPYNNKVPFYEFYLKQSGVVNFYGNERINITKILNSCCFMS